MIEEHNPYEDLGGLFEKYNGEPELKMWAGVYITKESDTNVHPFVAQTISDMLSSGRYKNVVELATHHGVLAKMWAQNNIDVKFTIIGEDNEKIHANLDGMPNVTMARNADDIKQVDFVIINYGLSDPDYNDMTRVMNILYQYGGRLAILGYESVRESIDDWARENDRLKRIYAKMDCIIYEVRGE